MNGVEPNLHFLPWEKLEKVKAGERWDPSPGDAHNFRQYAKKSAMVETKIGMSSAGRGDWWMMSFRTGGKRDTCRMYNTLPCTDARQFLTDPATYTKAGVIGAGLLTVLCPPVAAAAAGYG